LPGQAPVGDAKKRLAQESEKRDGGNICNLNAAGYARQIAAAGILCH
jgi:hypothetical protein